MKRRAAAARVLVGLLAATLPSCRPADGANARDVYGRTGRGVGEFSYPRAATVLDERLAVVDKTGRVQLLDLSDGRFSAGWQMPETAAGKPTGLGVAPPGTPWPGCIFVADTHYARVIVYDPAGREVARFGSFGDGPGQFRLPTDVAVDAAGNIYVSEYGGNDRVSKFNQRFDYLLSLGGPEAGERHFQRPQTIVIGRDGTLWITDACNHRVCHYDAGGGWLGSFGRLGAGPGELRFPYGLAQAADGTLVVCEYGNNRLQRFAPDGRALGTWGAPGRGRGQLAYPWAVEVDARNRIWVVDSGNNRVQAVTWEP